MGIGWEWNRLIDYQAGNRARAAGKVSVGTGRKGSLGINRGERAKR